ncbi:PLP-dependent aminotransferase family protein [Alteribacter natronophilus]|uniref:aminotransferase-like domain-containing protein n=1 Tax=Alteribacter natronophilus TaxID=2583810 RepID=UPI00110E4517|nr:PLP-dependent aminotransferase family protein [Alteribacter natronophilus]TMW71302.1 PLP-dependent aminotransferase family protein [Alteribacter natronophilus]
MDYIRKKIKQGEWSVGSALPSQRELAGTFGVNRSTVIAALEELIAEGLLETRPGKGTFVSDSTWKVMSAGQPANWHRTVTAGVHKASLETVKEINEREARGTDIQLGKSELAPALFPAAEIRDILHKRAAQLTSLSYEDPKGNRELREAVSSHLAKKQISVSPDSILIVSGALQALQLISIGLLSTGSTVYLERPSYLLSLSVFQSAHLRLTGLKGDEEGLVPEELEKRLIPGENAALYTIPTFHNPTGTLMNGNRRRTIMEICRNGEIPIIEDDVYGDLWIDDPPPPPLKSGDESGNVLYLGSLSKTLGPGLRIGWLAGPESVIDRLSDLKMQTDYGSSSLSQVVAADWLTGTKHEEHMKKVRLELKARRDTAVAALNEYAGDLADWQVPAGGLFIWVRFRTPLYQKRLFEKALDAGLLLNPGTIYSKHATRHVRLSYGYASLREIREGIRRVAEIVRRIQDSRTTGQ